MHFVVCAFLRLVAFYFQTHMIEANYRFEKSHSVSESTHKYYTDSNVIAIFRSVYFKTNFRLVCYKMIWQHIQLANRNVQIYYWTEHKSDIQMDSFDWSGLRW